ncbi:MAG: beta-lactamase family protein [Kordiimonadaceae bacterium]|nr:beta-lactamase family protein [Kordiimonadaceae bacterium]
MKFINLGKVLLASAILMVGSITPTSAVELSSLDDPKVTEAFIDGLVLPLMRNHRSPSGVVSIVKDGKLIFSKGYGFQNIEKQIKTNAESTLFRPGSISKLFTWVSVMQMVEQGKLDLDVDVNQYLKNFQIKDTFPGQPVTMRHIMTHSAGFEDGGLGYLIIDDIDNSYPLTESLKRFQVGRVNPPGAQTAYSNYATALAGLIVANLSGLDFNDYIQKHIFDVLGMKNSSFHEPLPENLIDNMAVAYAFQGGKFVPKPFEIVASFSPAGAASATATDMAIFAQAILNGGEYNGARILSAETTKQMLTRNFSHDQRLMGMALGFYETERNGVRLVGHGGDTAYFHSDLGIDHANNLAFFISFSGAGGASVRSALAPAFYNAFAPVEIPVVTPPADFSERAANYAGEYRFWRSGFNTVEKVMGLGGGIVIAPTANNSLFINAGSRTGEYIEIDNNLFQQVGSLTKIAFQEDANGTITGFIYDGMPFMSTYKAPFYFTSSFQYSLLGFSFFVFVGVLLGRFFQRQAYKARTGAEKTVARASVIIASANVLTVIFGIIMVTAVGSQLGASIPTAFTLWLWLPIITTVLGFYHVYNAVIVWKDGLLAGRWARVRYSLIAAAALFMCWFYHFWNILGFRYLT